MAADEADAVERCRWRLAEAIAWWRLRESGRVPEYQLGQPVPWPNVTPYLGMPESERHAAAALLQAAVDAAERRFRTLALQPDDDYWWRQPFPVAERIVQDVADRRAGLLRQHDAYPERPATSLEGGRLLLYALNESLAMCATLEPSRGYCAWDNDSPTWDLWITCFMADGGDPTHRRYKNAPNPAGWQWESLGWPSTYLLSWVPPAYLGWLERAVEVSPEQCIQWVWTDNELTLSYPAAIDTSFLRRLGETGLFDHGS